MRSLHLPVPCKCTSVGSLYALWLLWWRPSAPWEGATRSILPLTMDECAPVIREPKPRRMASVYQHDIAWIGKNMSGISLSSSTADLGGGPREPLAPHQELNRPAPTCTPSRGAPPSRPSRLHG